MKIFLDAFPALAFLGALLFADIYVATGVLIGALWLSVLLWRLQFKTFRSTHVWIAVAATLLGGLTLYLHNPLFIKWKPTLVYCVFGIVFAANAALQRPPLLEKAMGPAFDMPPALWRKLDFVWAAFWFGCAALNLVVAYNFSEKVWGTYKIVGGFLLPMLFFLAHLPFIGRYLKDDEKTAS
jgi:intracellular septation protein